MPRDPDMLRVTPHRVRRESPQVLAALAADLDDIIEDLSGLLEDRFHGHREHRAGDAVRDATIRLFDLWCEKSRIVPPGQAKERLVALFQRGALKPRDVTNTIKELGLTGDEVTSVRGAWLALPAESRSEAATVQNALWLLFRAHAKTFCVQTAHVMLARVLLYRSCEEQAGCPRRLSGAPMVQAFSASTVPAGALSRPATHLLEQARRRCNRSSRPSPTWGNSIGGTWSRPGTRLSRPERGIGLTGPTRSSNTPGKGRSTFSMAILLKMLMSMSGETSISTICPRPNGSDWVVFTRPRSWSS